MSVKKREKEKLQYIILTLTLLTMLYLTVAIVILLGILKRKVQTSKHSFHNEMKSRKHVHGLTNDTF